jgi:predicted phosphodiesterase
MRYGLVSDIHSNLAALEAVLRAIEAQGPIDGLLCMGDIIGYGPEPNEVVERLRQYSLFSICGNHDMAVLGEISLADFNRDAIDANVWTRIQLLPEYLEWIQTLPPMAKFDDKVTLAHGSPVEPVWEYLTSTYSAARSFEAYDTQLCFVGHTHLPRIFIPRPSENGEEDFPRAEMLIPESGDIFEIGESRAIVNPGSVGQPRDSDKRAAYAVYDDAEMTIVFGRVAYDISRTQELMKQAQLPLRLIMRLDYGL